MRVRAISTVTAMALAASLPLAGPVAAQDTSPEPPAGPVTLTLLHNNDGESSLLPITYAVGEDEVPLAIGGVAAFASVTGREIAAARTAGNSVVNVYAGDSFLASATLACSLPPAPPRTPIYDAVAQRLIPYDVHVFGNHEFDYGPDFLLRFVRTFRDGGRPTQPFLSANLDFSGEDAWARQIVQNGLIDGAATRGRVVARSAIVRDSTTDEAFGVVGATTPALPTISSPRDVTVTETIEATAAAVQTEIDRLQRRGIDRIILVSHLQDIDNDRELVGLLSGVDIAVAGGGDELLGSDAVDDELELLPGETQEVAGTYPTTQEDADGRSVPIVTTAGNYKYLGRLDVVFDAEGEVSEVLAGSSYPRRVIPETQDGTQIADLGITDAVPPTQELVAQVQQPVEACLTAFAETPVALSEVVVNVARGGSDPFELGVRSAETNGGNLVADAFIAAYDQYADASGLPPRGADNLVIAVQNGGGIRQNAGNLLPEGGTAGGAISRLDTINVLPFDNTLVSVDAVSASDLKAVLERSCESNGGGGFLQVSGITYTCDLTREAGDQAISVTFTNGTIDTADDLEVIDDAGVVAEVGPFRIVTNQFTAAGGDDYPVLAALSSTRLVTAAGTQIFYEQALRRYLQTFPATGEDEVPTILATDPRYAAEEGEGRITIVRP